MSLAETRVVPRTRRSIMSPAILVVGAAIFALTVKDSWWLSRFMLEMAGELCVSNFLSERISKLPDRPAVTKREALEAALEEREGMTEAFILGGIWQFTPNHCLAEWHGCDSYICRFNVVLICMPSSCKLAVSKPCSILGWVYVQALKVTHQMLSGTLDGLPDIQNWRGQLQLCFQVDLQEESQAYSSTHHVGLHGHKLSWYQFNPQCI